MGRLHAVVFQWIRWVGAALGLLRLTEPGLDKLSQGRCRFGGIVAFGMYMERGAVLRAKLEHLQNALGIGHTPTTLDLHGRVEARSDLDEQCGRPGVQSYFVGQC
jgi:hypothetical protein